MIAIMSQSNILPSIVCLSKKKILNTNTGPCIAGTHLPVPNYPFEHGSVSATIRVALSSWLANWHSFVLSPNLSQWLPFRLVFICQIWTEGVLVSTVTHVKSVKSDRDLWSILYMRSLIPGLTPRSNTWSGTNPLCYHLLSSATAGWITRFWLFVP